MKMLQKQQSLKGDKNMICLAHTLIASVLLLASVSQAQDYPYNGYALETQMFFRASHPQLQLNKGPLVITGQQCQVSIEINDVFDSPVRRPVVVIITTSDETVEFSPPVMRPFLGGLGRPEIDHQGNFRVTAAQVFGGGYDGGGEWTKHVILKYGSGQVSITTPNSNPYNHDDVTTTCTL
jgi:hypothetical protein